MSTEATLQTCLLCEGSCDQGEFVSSMPVCRYCLQGRPQPGKRVGIFVPPVVALRRLALLLPGMAVGFVLGGAIGVFALWRLLSLDLDLFERLVLYGTAFVFSGFFGALLLFFPSAVILFSRIQHVGVEAWKAHLVDALGLCHVLGRSDVAVSLVLFCWRRPRLWDLSVPMEIGLLLRSPQGLVFCGSQGTRTVIPFSKVLAAGTERLKLFPPRTAVRLQLQAGEAVCGVGRLPKTGEALFAFLDEKSFKADREKAECFNRSLLPRLRKGDIKCAI